MQARRKLVDSVLKLAATSGLPLASVFDTVPLQALTDVAGVCFPATTHFMLARCNMDFKLFFRYRRRQHSDL